MAAYEELAKEINSASAAKEHTHRLMNLVTDNNVMAQLKGIDLGP